MDQYSSISETQTFYLYNSSMTLGSSDIIMKIESKMQTKLFFVIDNLSIMYRVCICTEILLTIQV